MLPVSSPRPQIIRASWFDRDALYYACASIFGAFPLVGGLRRKRDKATSRSCGDEKTPWSGLGEREIDCCFRRTEHTEKGWGFGTYARNRRDIRFGGGAGHTLAYNQRGRAVVSDESESISSSLNHAIELFFNRAVAFTDLSRIWTCLSLLCFSAAPSFVH